MLKGILYSESETPSDVIENIAKSFQDVGWHLAANFFETPPSIENIFKHDPAVLIASGSVNGRLWSFLLRLKQFRLEDKEWPKIICPHLASQGIYLPESNNFDPNYEDYYIFRPPYSTLIDLSSQYPIHDLEACLPTLELEFLAKQKHLNKQWTLTDGSTDFGRITFSQLIYGANLEWPVILCNFQPFPRFSEISEFFPNDTVRDEKSLYPGQWSLLYLNHVSLYLRPTNALNHIDAFLSKANGFYLYIHRNEARLHISSSVIDYSKQF